jgi:protein involved in ribonucleotide reduction
VLPYQQATSNKISRFLTKYNIKTVHIPKKKKQAIALDHQRWLRS